MTAKTKADFFNDGRQAFLKGEPTPAEPKTWQQKAFMEGYGSTKQALDPVSPPPLKKYVHGIRGQLQVGWGQWPPAARGHMNSLLLRLEREMDIKVANRIHRKILVNMNKYGPKTQPVAV